MVFDVEMNFTSITDAKQLAAITDKGYKYLWQKGWKTEAKNLDMLDPEASIMFLSDNFNEAYIEGDRYIAIITLNYGNLGVKMAAKTREVLEDAKAKIQAAFQPVVVPKEKTKNIPVQFWTMGDHGPSSYHRKITVPTWEEIQQNYTESNREMVDNLIMNPFNEGEDGARLVLWHGEPGTGKTYALRALAYEWQLWCETHYIVDPERFFGSDSNYMLRLLLSDVEDDDEEDVIFQNNGSFPIAVGERAPKRKKWKLLIFEDTGELMSHDAASRSGQGLSRLLNVVDGLIGQGLRIIVLITTNEELKTLHKAVQRPGRCSSLIKFNPFARMEAEDWLAAHNVSDVNVNGGMTIAELYEARQNDKKPITREKATIGFA